MSSLHLDHTGQISGTAEDMQKISQRAVFDTLERLGVDGATFLDTLKVAISEHESEANVAPSMFMRAGQNNMIIWFMRGLRSFFRIFGIGGEIVEEAKESGAGGSEEKAASPPTTKKPRKHLSQKKRKKKAEMKRLKAIENQED